jgi:uncharacterized protein (UPF0332 family)
MGDADGACRRAYYAVFDIARAALIAARAPVPSEIAKTHAGLISAFSLHFVKSGLISPELGHFLNKAHQVRLVADYKGDPVEPEIAKEIVQQAAHFVEKIPAKLL